MGGDLSMRRQPLLPMPRSHTRSWANKDGFEGQRRRACPKANGQTAQQPYPSKLLKLAECVVAWCGMLKCRNGTWPNVVRNGIDESTAANWIAGAQNILSMCPLSSTHDWIDSASDLVSPCLGRESCCHCTHDPYVIIRLTSKESF